MSPFAVRRNETATRNKFGNAALFSQKRMSKMETLLRTTHSVALQTDALNHLHGDSQVLDYGMIIICRRGQVRIHTNFDVWTLTKGSVITLFPNDVIKIDEASTGFSAQWLRYDAALLREASLQVEHTVYSQLRNDRCRLGQTMVSRIVDGMFGLLDVFFALNDCGCLCALVLSQLQAFFIGYHDYLRRFPEGRPEEKSSPRVRELFNHFMLNLENHYKSTHTAADYAAMLNITPKYLNNIVNEMTGHSTKVIIDHFVVLQIKLSLRRSEKSVRELAWEYSFEDDAFFCHYFKRHTGKSPHQYRKERRGDSA